MMQRGGRSCQEKDSSLQPANWAIGRSDIQAGQASCHHPSPRTGQRPRTRSEKAPTAAAVSWRLNMPGKRCLAPALKGLGGVGNITDKVAGKMGNGAIGQLADWPIGQAPTTQHTNWLTPM